MGTILYEQAGSPRQIVPISETEAVVSDLRQQLVRIRTVPPYGKPLEYISIPRWVEYLVFAENKIFGMTQGGLYVFDANHIDKEYARVIKEVYNEENTKTCLLMIDKNGMIWGLINQKRGGMTTGITLKCVDPKREKVVKSYTLPFGDPDSQKPGDIIGAINYNRTDIDPTGTWIYFNVKTRSAEADEKGLTEQQSVYRMHVETGVFEHYQDSRREHDVRFRGQSRRRDLPVRLLGLHPSKGVHPSLFERWTYCQPPSRSLPQSNLFPKKSTITREPC